MAYHQPAAEHPLVQELALLARRAEPDVVLKARYLAFRKECLATVGRRVPGLLAKLVAEEVNRLVDTVLVEGRQWRETGEWEDHRRHLQTMRAAATVHLFLSRTGAELARAGEPPPAPRWDSVRRFDDA